jgi:hypothetical protein
MQKYDDTYLPYANSFLFVHIPFPPKHMHAHFRTAHIKASFTFIRIQIQPGYFLAQIL